MGSLEEKIGRGGPLCLPGRSSRSRCSVRMLAVWDGEGDTLHWTGVAGSSEATAQAGRATALGTSATTSQPSGMAHGMRPGHPSRSFGEFIPDLP